MDFLRTSLSYSFLHFVSRILLLSIRGLKPQHFDDSDAALKGRSSTSCVRMLFLLPVDLLASGCSFNVPVLLLAPAPTIRFNLSSYRPIRLFRSLYFSDFVDFVSLASGRKRLRRNLLHLAATQAKHALATTGKGQVMRRDEGGELVLAM